MRARATHSLSCAGLSRASMTRRHQKKSYGYLCFIGLMDCRDKPGNDIRWAGLKGV